MSTPLSDICPMEAVFFPTTIPCEYPRGHDGPHSYITHTVEPLCDECGLIVCVCSDTETSLTEIGWENLGHGGAPTSASW